jgi:hypothetical protein
MILRISWLFLASPVDGDQVAAENIERVRRYHEDDVGQPSWSDRLTFARRCPPVRSAGFVNKEMTPDRMTVEIMHERDPGGAATRTHTGSTRT